MRWGIYAAVTALMATIGTAQASDAVIGEEKAFTSPNGVEEKCVRIAPIPGGSYSKGDAKDESDYCSIDLNSRISSFNFLLVVDI